MLSSKQTNRMGQIIYLL